MTMYATTIFESCYATYGRNVKRIRAIMILMTIPNGSQVQYRKIMKKLNDNFSSRKQCKSVYIN